MSGTIVFGLLPLAEPVTLPLRVDVTRSDAPFGVAPDVLQDPLNRPAWTGRSRVFTHLQRLTLPPGLTGLITYSAASDDLATPDGRLAALDIFANGLHLDHLTLAKHNRDESGSITLLSTVDEGGFITQQTVRTLGERQHSYEAHFALLASGRLFRKLHTAMVPHEDGVLRFTASELAELEAELHRFEGQTVQRVLGMAQRKFGRRDGPVMTLVARTLGMPEADVAAQVSGRQRLTVWQMAGIDKGAP